MFSPDELPPAASSRGSPGAGTHPRGLAAGRSLCLPRHGPCVPSPAWSCWSTAATPRSGRLRSRRRALPRHRPLTVGEQEAAPQQEQTARVGLAAGRGVWVVLPTYNERENLEAHQRRDPGGAARGRAAHRRRQLAGRHRRCWPTPSPPASRGSRCCTAPARRGWAPPTATGSAGRWGSPACGRWCRWTPTSATIRRTCRGCSRPLMRDADLSLGSRYVRGGGTVGWPLYRQLISRGGTIFARTVLLLPYRDLTGGFKAWRRELLEAVRLRDANASGYGFQIEMTWWSHRRGAKIVQVPDHLPRAGGWQVEDVGQHRARGAAARHQASAQCHREALADGTARSRCCRRSGTDGPSARMQPRPLVVDPVLRACREALRAWHSVTVRSSTASTAHAGRTSCARQQLLVAGFAVAIAVAVGIFGAAAWSSLLRDQPPPVGPGRRRAARSVRGVHPVSIQIGRAAGQGGRPGIGSTGGMRRPVRSSSCRRCRRP